MISNSAARVAALAAGDVQMIEGVPTADIEQLKKDCRASRSPPAVSNRVIYLHLDSGREKQLALRHRRGAASRWRRTRCATRACARRISKMIDRDAIVSRIMEGQAQPAGQLLPETFFGTSKRLKPEKYDPEGAKKLLAEAGYPNGFGAARCTRRTTATSTTRECAQAVAQFLTRGGIPDQGRDAMPSAVFFSRGSKLEFSLLLAGWGAETGENSLVAALAARHLRCRCRHAAPANQRPLLRRRRGRAARHRPHDHRRYQARPDARRGQRERRWASCMGSCRCTTRSAPGRMQRAYRTGARADQYTLAFEVKPASKP